MDDAMLKCLRRPFPEKEVQIKPGQGGLKYISHGSVTARLLDCDPLWSSEILEEYRTPDEQHCLGVKMALTIGGHTRIEVGGTQRPGANIVADLKNCYSDALKRCAMRFGVALEMWEHLIDSQDDEDYGNGASEAPQSPSAQAKNSTSNRALVPQTQRGATQNQSQRDDPVEASLISSAASQRQLRYMQAVAREAGYDAAALDELAKREFGQVAMAISRKDASALIDFMQAESGGPVAPQPKAEANGQPMKTSSKQDPDDPNSVLPTKRREDMLKAIFEHTRGQITATDLNNLQQETIGTPLTRITIQQSRDLYTRILNMNEHERTSIRDDLRRKYQPLTETLMKKLWAVVGKHTPAGVEKDNYLHVQLFEHLGLGSVKDMSTYDVDKMISVYEGQDFLDPEPAGEGDEQVTWD